MAANKKKEPSIRKDGAVDSSALSFISGPMEEIFKPALEQDKTAYELPAEIANDPGLALKYVCLVNFPDGVSQGLQSRFGVSRQTAWLWCKAKMGVPAAQRDKLIELTTTKKKSADGIWLPTGVQPEELLRKGSLQGRPPFSRRNQFLLHLLCEVVSGKHDGLELGSLDGLVSSHLPQLGSPHRIWQWAYVQGGIPESYVHQTLRGMIHHSFYKSLEDRGVTLESFPAFLKSYLIAPRRSGAKAEPNEDKKPRRKRGAREAKDGALNPN